jgi:hypothetical protein
MPVGDQHTTTPVLYVFFGMIATGKSTLAESWARHRGMDYYNSDRVRKELAGIDPSAGQRETMDGGIYTKDFSQQTYRALLERAEAALAGGESVVLDASYQYAADRRDVKTLARRLNCQVYFVLCHCPEEEMKRRMEARQHDPAAVSDGRWEIYLQQKKRFEAPAELDDSELITINTEASPGNLLRELDHKLP